MANNEEILNGATPTDVGATSSLHQDTVVNLPNLVEPTTDFDFLNSDINPVTLNVIDSIKQQTPVDNNFKLLDYEKDLQATSGNDLNWLFNPNPEAGLNVAGGEMDLNKTHKRLNDGTFVPLYDSYLEGIDNADNLALRQSAAELWGKGLSKFVGKTALNVLDGTVGTVVGLAQGLEDGRVSSIYNNGFSKWIDDLNAKLDYQLDTYQEADDRNKGFLASMFTDANFWADDVLGGLSFLAGTIISEGAWAAATGGASLANILARNSLKAFGKKAIKTNIDEIAEQGLKNADEFLLDNKKILKEFNRTVPYATAGKVFNNLRFMYTSAGYEAGVEARSMLKESMDSYMSSFEDAHGRKPTISEISEFYKEAVPAANNVFAANVGLVGASNIAMFGSYFNVGTSISGKLNSAINKKLGVGFTKQFDDDLGRFVFKEINPTKTQKVLGNSINILKDPFREGFIEEGGQAVISGSAEKWLNARFNPASIKENLSVVEAAKESFAHTYGTSEGFKEVGIGMIIGLIGGAGRRGKSGDRTPFGIGEFSSEQSYNKTLVDGLNKSDENFVNLTKSQLGLVDRFLDINQINAATKSANDNLKKGDVFQASMDFDMAQFSFLNMRAKAGLLEDSMEDFGHIIDNLPNESFESIGLNEEQRDAWKENAKQTYSDNLDLFKKSREISEGLNPNLEVDGIGNINVSDELALNLFLGAKSQERANEVLDEIEQLTGKAGIANSVKLYNNISRRAKTRANRMLQLEQEIIDLEQEYSRVRQSFANNSVDKTNTERDVSDKSTVKTLDNIDENQKKLLKKLEEKRIELDELQTKLDNRVFNSNHFLAGISNLFDTEVNEVISDASILNSLRDINSLEDFLNELQEELDNPNIRDSRATSLRKAKTKLQFLINEYRKNTKAFRDFNIVYEQMLDPEYLQQQNKGITKIFNILGKPLNNERLLNEELEPNVGEKLTLTQKLQKYVNDNRDSLSSRDILNLQTIARIASNSFVYNYSTPDRIQDDIEDEEWNNILETNSISGATLDKIVDKIFNKVPLGDREFFLSKAFKKAVKRKLLDRKLELGDSLESEFTPTSTEGMTLLDALKATISDIAKQNRHLDNLDVNTLSKEDEVSQEDIDRYEELKTLSTNTELSEGQEKELQDLTDKLNDWGAINGTFNNGIKLTDLIDQMLLLEGRQEEESSVIDSMIPLEDLLEDLDFKNTSRARNYDILQSYEKAFVSKNSNNRYVIHNLTLNNFISNLNLPNLSIHRNNKAVVELDSLKDNNFKEGTYFILKFGDIENQTKVRIDIGVNNNLEVSNLSKEIINNNSNIRIMPSNNIATKYQPLLKRIETESGVEYLPIDSDFSFEPNVSINNEAIYSLKNGDNLFMEVSLSNEFNKGLFSKYNKDKSDENLKELEDKLVIYIKDKSNNLIGVFKTNAKEVADSSSDNVKAMFNIRKMALNRVLEDATFENETIDLNLRIPVSEVMTGHPNLIIKEVNGVAVVQSLPITESASKNIINVGYVLNGDIVTKNNNNNFSAHPYMTKVMRSEEYRDTKIPFVVINYKGKKFAYPVEYNKETVDLSQEVSDILQSNLPNADKILRVNKLILDNRLDVNQLGLRFEDFTGEFDLESYLENFSEVLTDPNLDSWMVKSKSMKDILLNEIKINIDLNNKPFHSPKVKVQMNNIGGMDADSLVNIDYSDNLDDVQAEEVSDIQEEDC